MTNATHTPGPWHSDWQFIVAPDPAGVHPDIYIAEIAETDEEGRVASSEQQEANARLIAAAPDLLVALEYAYELLGKVYDGEQTDVGSALQPCANAIAQAKGGAI